MRVKFEWPITNKYFICATLLSLLFPLKCGNRQLFMNLVSKSWYIKGWNWFSGQKCGISLYQELLNINNDTGRHWKEVMRYVCIIFVKKRKNLKLIYFFWCHSFILFFIQSIFKRGMIKENYISLSSTHKFKLLPIFLQV